MRSRLFVITLFGLTGCNLFPYQDYRYYPAGNDVSILVNSEYNSHTSTEINYTIRVASFNYYNAIYFEAGDYNATGNGTASITAINGLEQSISNASTTLFLIDQSSGWAELDPHNMRTKGVNKFLEDIKAPSSVLLGAFASQGILDSSPTEYSPSGFTSQWSDREFLFDLSKRSGGTSPLYKAIDDALTKLTITSLPRKNLVLLVHSMDDGISSPSLSSLVSKAIDNFIHISFIVMGDNPPMASYWKLVNQSNGMVVMCPSEKHLLTVLNHLESLINGTVYVSDVKIKFQPTGGNITSGNSFDNVISIFDKSKNYKYNPMNVEIDIP